MRLLLPVFSLLFSVSAFSSIEVIKEKTQSFTPDQNSCSANDTCDLKSFRFVEQKKKVLLPKQEDRFAYFLTDTRAVYETSSVDKIEKYAIVQKIKGCQFESAWDGTTETRYMNVIRNHMGQNVKFQHKTWQIDNDYLGPIYTGVQFNDGHIDPFYILNWNDDPKSLDANKSHFYGREKPTKPVVFATDLPGAAYLEESATVDTAPLARNSSLEFSTCIFKTSDLPQTTDADGSNIDFSKAVKCFSWDHKFVYDFAAKKFKSPAAIEDVCLKPITN